MNKNNLTLEVFSKEAFLAVNRSLINSFGLVPAAFLSNLIDKLKYFQEADRLKPGGWFYQTHERQMEQTGISTLHTLRKCKKLFQENGILHTKWMGQPAKEYYRINIRRLLNQQQLASIDSKRLADMKTIDLADTDSKGLGEVKLEDLGDAKAQDLYIDKHLKEKQTKKKQVKKNEGSWDWNNLFPKEWMNNTTLQITLEAFTKYRRTEIKKLLDPLRAKRIANKLQKYPIEVAIIALTQSMENCWTGVFPESIKPPKSTPPNKSPEEILTDCEAFGHFRRKSGKYSPALFNGVWKDIYLPALEMMSDQKCEQELAQALASFADQLNRESQKPDLKERIKMEDSESVRDQHNAARWARVPGMIVLLGKYVDWLGYGGQDWIKDRSLNLFKFDNAVFRKWRSWYEEDIGVDIITGKAV